MKESKCLWGLLILLSIAIGSCTSGNQPNICYQNLVDPNHETWKTMAPDSFQVRIETSTGDFTLEVYRHWSPNGVDRFYNLVRNCYFNDSRFFRVRQDFIAQFGIPGDPRIANIWRHMTLHDDSVRVSNLRGTIAYAMTGPHTRTTQLYINLSDNSRLDNEGFSPIGRIISGIANVDSLFADYDELAGGGMRAGKQDQMFEGGNRHLDDNFPKLDRLIRATILP